MIIARETDADRVTAAKQDQGGNTTTDEIIKTCNQASSSSTTISSWSRLKDPRIVRVSRAFGGKDRHSKVCTVRGLRDRRVRLSVPTAIQLYDLQDRLGLNQPSKVVDWLLNVAKHEIDELPPLQIPPGSFNQSFHQPVLAHDLANKQDLRIGGRINWDDHSTEPSGSNVAWDSDAILRPNKSKEVARGDSSDQEKETWSTRSEEESGKQQTSHHGAYFSSNNFFSRLGHPSSSQSVGLLNSYNSLIKWDPSNLSLTPQQEDFHNFSVAPLPSGGPPQVLVYQPTGITQSYFPSHIAASTQDYVPKQINFQTLNPSSESDHQLSNSLAPPINDSTSQFAAAGRPFHLLSTTTKLFPSQNDHSEGKQDDDNEFHSR
ncbi:hypothetical protein ACH5RR_011254 [Cinchona calisaya]|uniref:TCP domain-containing protein n=1 Tax=Cinchona calisaya TaxID=153742 RepID=A0ABD3A5W2_9GENT